ncbi:GGDEF domain-containing protein [Pseudonocardiaceae bacterium YIM PH 21723]|nr:GGDEF domain-containing protein [Pseudonocardiaceae bacterium YIM PH 21723]
MSMPTTRLLPFAAALGVTGSAALAYYAHGLRRQVDQQKQQLTEAQHDRTTGLLRREPWEDLAAQKLRELGADRAGWSLWLLDLDKFKPVNDTLGHQVGDWVLATFTQQLRDVLGKEALIGRLGGDEFVALVPWDGAWLPVVDQLAPALSVQVPHGLVVGVSIGIVCLADLPDSDQPLQVALPAADFSMYQAKFQGLGTYRFDPGTDTAAVFAGVPSPRRRYRDRARVAGPVEVTR